MSSVVHDVKYAVRALRKSPWFTTVAVLTLALGIGANTVMFSLVYATLLRPLPYRDAGRIVVLRETTPKVGAVSVSYPDFLDWRAQSRRFSAMAFVHGVGFDLTGTAQAASVSGEAVSANFLSLLGVRPILGRDFDAADGEPGAAPVAIVSYGLWQSRFGGDRSVVGKTLTLDGRVVTIVGVLPQEFRSLDALDVLLPIGVWRATHADAAGDRGQRGDAEVIARLAPGATLTTARVEMHDIAAGLAREYPATNDQFGAELQPVRDFFSGDAATPLLILLSAVMFVLLIACANVANLMLARSAARRREMALRVALGAGRARLASQMITESAVLALVGGIAGLLVAVGGVRVAAHMMPTVLPSDVPVGLNGPVLLFTAGVVVLVTCLFGVAPAARGTRPDLRGALTESGRSVGGGRRHHRVRAILSGAEIALAVVLLAGAGLMMRTMVRLLSVDPGFRTSGVVTAEIVLRAHRYASDTAALQFWERLLDRARAVPGVRSAAIGTVVPFTENHSRADITIEGMALPRPGSFPHPDYHFVSPDYLGVLRIPLLRGRDFTVSDDEHAPRVGIVNARVAREYFPGESPIGKRFMFGHPSTTHAPAWITIVGVVGDTKLYGLAQPSRLEVYLPYRQYPQSDMTLLLSTAGNAGVVRPAIRSVVASIDKDQPVGTVATMDALRAESVGSRRATLMLLSVFSALAVVLAAIGIYGVVSYSAAQRTHEIGIRVALGARERDVVAMVLAEGGRIAVAGIAVGVVVSIGLTRTMAGLLYGVSPSDPMTLGAAALLLVAVALFAVFIPARRATRIHPIEALRSE